MFIAPTEPAQLKAIGVSSSLPEKHGVDILWESELGLVGVQRKRFPDDFLASVNDDRLYREFPMMEQLAVKVLLLEGKQYWNDSGQLVRSNSNVRWPWNRTSHRNYLTSLHHLFGVQTLNTDSLQDTIDYLPQLRAWSEKTSHDSLLRRPGPPKDLWGSTANRSFALHLLQSIPGLGPKVAGAIYDHFNGVPFTLTVTRAELLAVPGVGPKLATAIEEMFHETSTD